ncbi:hypothetical protein ACP4OV_002770 [Aristida adscensionis]
MAAAAAAARGSAPAMTLRDFLELGCESSSDGFRSYPRRLPCDGDAQRAVRLLAEEAGLRRSPSWSPSAFFLPKSPGALARFSSLSRSFSRRLSFWRRRDGGDDDDGEEMYVDERDSGGFPSPLVSSCSSSECAESEADAVAAEEKPTASTSERDEPSPPSTSSSLSSSSADRGCTGAPGGDAGDGRKEAVDGEPVGRSMEVEDKQQLSPVSVLDFPFDDDDGDERSDAGTCSPSFHRCPPDLQRTKTPALHKIRRFDGLPEEVDAVDLEARFAASESADSVDAHSRCTRVLSNSGSDDDSAPATAAAAASRRDEELQSIEQPDKETDDEHLLLRRVLQDADAAVDEASEALLLDFFADEVRRARAAAGTVVGAARPVDGGKAAAALVGAAGEWLRGAGPRWGVADVMFSGAAAVADMERSRRWACAREEERDVGAAVEGMVADELVEELVAELVAPRWRGDKGWRGVEL